MRWVTVLVEAGWMDEKNVSLLHILMYVRQVKHMKGSHTR